MLDWMFREGIDAPTEQLTETAAADLRVIFEAADVAAKAALAVEKAAYAAEKSALAAGPLSV